MVSYQTCQNGIDELRETPPSASKCTGLKVSYQNLDSHSIKRNQDSTTPKDYDLGSGRLPVQPAAAAAVAASTKSKEMRSMGQVKLRTIKGYGR